MPKSTQDISSYIKQTKTGIWRFRLKVPKAIQKAYGKVEESFSLDTKDLDTARRKGQQYLEHFKDRFEQFANPALLNLDLVAGNESDYQRITDFALQVHLKMDGYFKAMPSWQRLVLAGNMDNDTIVKGMFADYLKSENIVLSESNERFDYLLERYKAMALERLRYHHIADERDNLNAIQDHASFSNQFIAKPADKKQAIPFKTLSAILTQFLDENETVKANKDEVTKFKAVVNNLIDFLGGDRPINLVSNDEAIDFLNAAVQYPINRPKNISFTDAIKLQSEQQGKTISENTFLDIKKRLRRLYEFADFRYRDAEVKNVFDIKTKFMKNKGRETEAKRNFTSEELKTIFNHTRTFKEKAVHHYWLPLLFLYSGARNGEFANRELADVKQVFGIWVMDLTVNKKTDQNGIIKDIRVKNEVSKRMIPIAQKLIDLGFIDYVQGLKAKGERWLFPQFNRSGRIIKGELRPSGNPSEQYTSAFARMMDKIGLPDETISLHSFRHTWVTAATHQGVDDDHRVAIVGHGGKGDVHRLTYTHKDLTFMKEALDMVTFEGLPI